jgi:hypothetical protein
MDWVKNIFGIGSQDKQPSKSVPDRDKNTNRDTSNKKRRAQQPLLVNTVGGSTRHKDQGLDWYRAGLHHDEDGDEAHGFIVCDEKDEKTMR